MKTFARELRRNTTKEESILWKHLRNRNLSGFKFRRQVIIEPYIVDFVCFEAKLIIEADGGQHSEQIEYDSTRDEVLKSLGYEILRFWNHEIIEQTDSVLEQIRSRLYKIPSPQPSP